jgi:outer membrane protein OmpA-like peptidoglycan-associated protein
MRDVMNKNSRVVLSSLMAALLFAGAGSQLAFASDDAAKLKELEKAMSAPEEGGKKKYRTRAIVFDNDQQAAAPADAPKAAGGGDCSAVTPDSKAIPVDFAIQFKLGSAEVAPASEPTLREIAKILSLNPERCVLVEGHTDAIGNAERNMELSRDRAGSVVKFIVEKAGIDRSRLVPIGKGSSDPMKNLNPRDPKNRRVVFKVVG